MGYDLKRYGKRCLITGASSGIGMEFANRLAAEGMDLVLVARRRDRLEQLAEVLSSEHSVQVMVIEADLSMPDAVMRVSDEVREMEIDFLILNAGFGYRGNFWEEDPGELAKMVSLNCIHVALLARLLIPSMVERRRGAVIIVSSVLGYLPGPMMSTYCATKSFDLMLGESMWPELKDVGIDLLNLCPSYTKTEFHTVAHKAGGGQDNRSRKADSPEMVVGLALKSIGRKMTVYPRDGRLAAMLLRLLPRKLVCKLSNDVMKKRAAKE